MSNLNVVVCDKKYIRDRQWLVGNLYVVDNGWTFPEKDYTTTNLTNCTNTSNHQVMLLRIHRIHRAIMSCHYEFIKPSSHASTEPSTLKSGFCGSIKLSSQASADPSNYQVILLRIHQTIKSCLCGSIKPPINCLLLIAGGNNSSHSTFDHE